VRGKSNFVGYLTLSLEGATSLSEPELVLVFVLDEDASLLDVLALPFAISVTAAH
jgi:hypothetical protein